MHDLLFPTRHYSNRGVYLGFYLVEDKWGPEIMATRPWAC